MSEEDSKNKILISSLYDYNFDKGEIKLKNHKCPRCGCIMANHKKPIERWTCGGCNYTEILDKKTTE